MVWKPRMNQKKLATLQEKKSLLRAKILRLEQEMKLLAQQAANAPTIVREEKKAQIQNCMQQIQMYTKQFLPILKALNVADQAQEVATMKGLAKTLTYVQKKSGVQTGRLQGMFAQMTSELDMITEDFDDALEDMADTTAFGSEEGRGGYGDEAEQLISNAEMDPSWDAMNEDIDVEFEEDDAHTQRPGRQEEGI